MVKRKKLKIAFIVAFIFMDIFLFLNFMLPMVQYEASISVLTPQEVIPEGTICKRDVTHEIPEYSYNDEIGSITFVEQELVVPLLYGDPSEGFVTAMEYGAAYDPNSSYPDGETTTVVSGHKHTDFGVLEDIELGDAIILEIDGNIYTYEVTDLKVIEDSDVDMVYYEGDDLVLYTCYPFTYSSFYSQRYAVVASPVSEVSC